LPLLGCDPLVKPLLFITHILETRFILELVSGQNLIFSTNIIIFFGI
jgi:hypothetical protein